MLQNIWMTGVDGEMDQTHSTEKYDLIITGGQVVDGDILDFACLDIAIRNGRIAAIGPNLPETARHVISAAGLLIFPGLIDPHVHLSLPMKGTLSSDSPSTGTAAALLGGVTSIVDFTLQKPGQSLSRSLNERLVEFNGCSYTDYAFHVNVTESSSEFWDNIASDLDKVFELGARSLKVFPCYSRAGMAIDPANLRRLFALARDKGFIILVHAEDDRILNQHEDQLKSMGNTGPRYFHLSHPAEAEAKAIADVIALAVSEQAPVYFVHVSTADGAAAILSGREKSTQPIYMETCPQYLFLTNQSYLQSGHAQFIVAPPLRALDDTVQIRNCIRRGAIDVVATDHCPFMKAQKEFAGKQFTDIPCGLPGVETRLPLLYTLGVKEGLLTLSDLIRLTSVNPAKIHGCYPNKGSLSPGADADLVLFDPRPKWPLTSENLHMNTDFSPYEDVVAQGKVTGAFLRGRQVVRDGELIGKPAGRYIRTETN